MHWLIVLLYAITLVFCILYCATITTIIIGWLRLIDYDKQNLETEVFSGLPSISVVIAMRNEEKNAPTLLNSLAHQDYPKKLLEIIIVDDHSSDATFAIIQSCTTNGNIKLLSLPQGITGKKAAIRYGVETSQGELVVTTDADCRMQAQWLTILGTFYSNHQSSVIIAPVIIKGNGLSGLVQSLEFLSLIASAAGSASLGHPVLCNGANLAFKRDTYLTPTNNYYTSAASGDDMFLLQSIKKQLSTAKEIRSQIRFIKSRQATVITNGQTNVTSFFAQRRRWAAKSKLFSDAEIVGLGVLVFGFNFLLVLFTFASIFAPTLLSFGLLLYFLKFLPDYILLHLAADYWHLKKSLWYFIPLQLLSPIYVTGVAIAGMFAGFNWKGRYYYR